jgi:tetratricopeptide (TPR) repeat protein
MDNSLRITSTHHKELCTNITLNEKKYLILTEDLGGSEHSVSTKVYLGGEIVSTRASDYKKIIGKPDFEKSVRELMQNQHELVISIMKTGPEKREKTPMDYLDRIMTLLQEKDHVGAINLLSSVLKKYPDEPYLLSYYGCLDAILNKNHTEGIKTCSHAIEILSDRVPFGQELFYPVLYLNLGRAYIASGNKQGAIFAFQKGLAFDKENRELLKEMKKLGIRKKPLLPYFARSNPINKYIGKILHSLKKKPSGRKGH